MLNFDHNIWIKLFYRDVIAAIIALASGDLFLFWSKKAHQIEVAQIPNIRSSITQAISKQKPISKEKNKQIGSEAPASIQTRKKLNKREDCRGK